MIHLIYLYAINNRGGRAAVPRGRRRRTTTGTWSVGTHTPGYRALGWCRGQRRRPTGEGGGLEAGGYGRVNSGRWGGAVPRITSGGGGWVVRPHPPPLSPKETPKGLTTVHGSEITGRCCGSHTKKVGGHPALRECGGKRIPDRGKTTRVIFLFFGPTCPRGGSPGAGPSLTVAHTTGDREVGTGASWPGLCEGFLWHPHLETGILAIKPVETTQTTSYFLQRVFLCTNVLKCKIK